MIIETRYRDIPWEEARQCAILADDSKASIWEDRRLKPVSIESPACDGHPHPWHACKGPFFYVIAGGNGCVCPHIVEIGD